MSGDSMSTSEINLEVTKLQMMFIKSQAFLTLFGGA